MPNRVTISKQLDKNTVVVVEAESASSVQVAMNDAMGAINSIVSGHPSIKKIK